MNGEVAPQEMKPGTIVLQYRNDSDCFLGMIAHRSMSRYLSKDSRMYYERFLNDSERPDLKEHVCLVLLWKGFQQYDQYFDEPLVKPFPWYETGKIRLAEEIDLYHEFNLMKVHAGSQSKALVRGVSLRRELFGFSGRQIMVLGLIQLIRWHVSGRSGDPADLIKLLGEIGVYWGDWCSKFLHELERAVPLE